MQSHSVITISKVILLRDYFKIYGNILYIHIFQINFFSLLIIKTGMKLIYMVLYLPFDKESPILLKVLFI